MKKTLIALMLLILAVSCGGPEPTAAEKLADDLEELTLHEFYDVSYRALISRTPETIVWLGLSDVFPLDDVGLNDLSDNYSRDTFAMHQVVLDVLQTYDRAALDTDAQLTYDVYQWHLQDVVDQLNFIYFDFAATYGFFGTQKDTEIFFTDIHPLATRQDADDYITRLHAVALKFSQLSDHLNLQHEAFVVEPKLTLQVAINQVTVLAQGSVDSNPYFTSFRDKLDSIAGLSSADRQSLLAAARAATETSVIPGYQQLLQTMQDLLVYAPPSIGVSQFRDGENYYAYMLKHHTTTNLTAQEIHQMGLDELQRIRSEMQQVFDQLGYPQNETLRQLFDRVAADGGTIVAADVLATYQGIIDLAQQNLGQAFDIFPAADVVVIGGDAGGFYIGPSFDGTRPGAFYASTTTDQPWFQMPSLTYHESIPGHHLQIAISMEQDVPAFRRLARSTSFVEGWALYAERLAFEMGWLNNDPYANLGRLQFEALRAARLVMDTGIHDLGWSFDEAVMFNQENVGATMGASQGAAGRYSIIPGQATAYMVGMLQILRVRQKAMDQLGLQFDLKEFHRLVLANGAIPLALLDAVVDRYIADKLAMQ